MYIDVKNENYGYSVATHGKYVGVGNPRLVRYTSDTSSLIQTGSVDVFRYDINTDEHVLIDTILKPFDPTSDILLAAESASIVSSSLHTEINGYDLVNRDKDILIDYGGYIHNYDNDYGHTLDCYNKRFAVGCRYFWDQVIIGPNVFDSSGSCVDIWDYNYSERTEYSRNVKPSIAGYGIISASVILYSSGSTSSLNFGTYDVTGSQLFFENISVPAGYNQVWVYGTTDLGSSDRYVVSKIPAQVEGGNVTFFYPLSLPTFYVTDLQGVIINDSTRFHIPNPNTEVTKSFGFSVSLNNDWLAIGSPYVSGSKGMVYLYKNDCTGSTLSWSFYQTVTSSSPLSGQLFGWDVSLNKSTDVSCPNRLVVGCGAPNNLSVSLFELSASNWIETFQFHQNTGSLYPLTFDTSSYPILNSSSYQTSSFGWAVSTWEDTVVIGAPRERNIFEYSGSSEYQQGTVYVFERCSDIPCPAITSSYRLVNKFYGDQTILKNNRLGYSVSIYGNNIAAGSPKRDMDSLSSCYVQNSLTQQNYCDSDLENTITGQWILITKNTSSLDWELDKVFQKKKKFMSPYRIFGYDVSIGDFSIVTGAPMKLSDLNRSMDVAYTESLDIALDSVMGRAYIYNLSNYRDKFHVGNAFYRNGTIVINSSGSAFEGLYFNPTTPYTYEYLWDYKSKHSIYEKQFVCTVEPGEFNVSTNPTAITKSISILDVNNNGVFDFQDLDIIMRYMQYKNSNILGYYSFDWSSSIVKTPDEISFYNFNADQWDNTDHLFSSSLSYFENDNPTFVDNLDFNQDAKVDVKDMNILWKYYSNRLDEKSYLSYINVNSQRKNVSDVLIYINNLSKRYEIPMIKQEFFDYESNYATDKTGSFLAPFVTTIGLYSGLELVAVAKLASPVKLPKTIPLNFVVKLDF